MQTIFPQRLNSIKWKTHFATWYDAYQLIFATVRSINHMTLNVRPFRGLETSPVAEERERPCRVVERREVQRTTKRVTKSEHGTGGVAL